MIFGQMRPDPSEMNSESNNPENAMDEEEKAARQMMLGRKHQNAQFAKMPKGGV